MTEKLKKAAILAATAHEGQLRKFSGAAYFTHLEAVAMKLEDETDQIVGYLHDIVEDTDITLGFVTVEFGNEIGAAVDAMTKRTGEGYVDYLKRVEANDIATRVKLADLEHNLGDLRHGPLREKYILARKYLEMGNE